MAARGAGWDAPTAVVQLALQLDHIDIKHPLAVVFEGDPPKEVGRSPLLKYTIDLELYFERVQPIRIVIYTLRGSGNGNGDGDDELERVGSVSASLGRLVSVGTCFMRLSDERADHRKGGLLKVNVSYVSSPWTSRRVTFKLAASQLDRMDLAGVGRSDPYFVLTREDTGEAVYTSEFIYNSLSCVWRPASVDFRVYDPDGNFDHDSFPVLFEVYDEDQRGPNDLIGTVSTTLGKLQDGTILDLVTTRHSGIPGKLTVISCSVERIPSFGEYLVNGLDLWSGIVIDFTASNMPAEDEKSLHHLDSENVYMQVIDAVLRPILQFDPDGEVDALGFGAKPSPDLPTEFDFALRGEDNIRCPGVEGVKEAYQDAVERLTLSGPAKLVPALDRFLHILKSNKSAKSRLRYLVVLVIADGVPMELEEFVKKIVELSTLPISVLFVGVGPGDFSRLKSVCTARPIRDSAGVSGRRESHRTLHFAHLKKCKQIILDELFPEQLKERQVGAFDTVDELSRELLKELRYMIRDFFVSASVLPVPSG